MESGEMQRNREKIQTMGRLCLINGFLRLNLAACVMYN